MTDRVEHNVSASRQRKGTHVNKEDMILISVDDHIVEPPDMFKNHLSKKYIDDAPHLVHNSDGSDAWKFRDTVIPNVALNAVAGRSKEEWALSHHKKGERESNVLIQASANS